MKPVFAVDVGGVLANHYHYGSPVAGARDVLQDLGQTYRLMIVSQCGLSTEHGTRKWLDNHDLAQLFEQQHYIRFVEPNKNRVLEQIEAKVFIDDRWKHVWPALQISISCLHLVGHGIRGPAQPGYYPINTWADVPAVMNQI